MWEILDMEPTSDIKSIKKAYAKMLTIYHPEEYPEEFQRLQSAYQSALRYAKQYKSNKADDIPPYWEEYDTIFYTRHESDSSGTEAFQEEKVEIPDYTQNATKKEEIPDYIQNATEGSNERFELNKLKYFDVIILMIQSAIISDNKDVIKECLTYLDTTSFHEIATHSYFISELRDVLLSHRLRNKQILKKMQSIYTNLYSSTNENGEKGILELIQNKISYIEQEKTLRKRAEVNKCFKVGIIIVGIYLAITAIYITQKNSHMIQIENVEEFCTLIKERYHISITKDDVKIRDDLPSIGPYWLNNIEKKLYYYEAEYQTLDNEHIFYGAMYTMDMDSMREAQYCVEQQLFKHYGNKYFNDYLNKDYFSDNSYFDELGGIWDTSNITFRLDVTEEQIDAVISAIEAFNNEFWAEEAIAMRKSTYSLTINFYDDEIKLSNFEPSSNSTDVEMTLSTNNHNIDSEKLRESLYFACNKSE